MQNKAVFRIFFDVFKSMLCGLMLCVMAFDAHGLNDRFQYNCTTTVGDFTNLSSAVCATGDKPQMETWFDSIPSSNKCYPTNRYRVSSNVPNSPVYYKTGSSIDNSLYADLGECNNHTYKIERVIKYVSVFDTLNASSSASFACCSENADCSLGVDQCYCDNITYENVDKAPYGWFSGGQVASTKNGWKYYGNNLECGNLSNKEGIDVRPLGFSIQFKCSGTGDTKREDFISNFKAGGTFNSDGAKVSEICSGNNATKWVCDNGKELTSTTSTYSNLSYAEWFPHDDIVDYPTVICVPESEGGGGEPEPEPEPEPDPDDGKKHFGYGEGASWTWPDQVTTSEIKNLVN